MTILDPNFTAISAPAGTAGPGVLRALGERASFRLLSDCSGPTAAVISGEIDLDCADELGTVLRTILRDCPRGLVLDLAAVSFCDCSGLRVLYAARAEARSAARYFAIGAHSHAVGRLLELTDAQSLLAHEERVDGAWTAL